MCSYLTDRYEGCGHELCADLPVELCKTAKTRAVDPDAEMPCISVKDVRNKKVIVPGDCHNCTSRLFAREPCKPRPQAKLKVHRGLQAISGNAQVEKPVNDSKTAPGHKTSKQPVRKRAKLDTSGKENVPPDLKI
ncbi:hypothetical protein Dda_2979 [Drechslerella dactyloides]|uniref:Uncharacterized protein n=1 Tax=Drechslerella dactyloides TaxID=74499 RepID=A0AAD6J224_DREDA|nr:hypothetical protein Dda_2979 [Drechslerella dactyloides]